MLLSLRFKKRASARAAPSLHLAEAELHTTAYHRDGSGEVNGRGEQREAPTNQVAGKESRASRFPSCVGWEASESVEYVSLACCSLPYVAVYYNPSGSRVFFFLFPFSRLASTLAPVGGLLTKENPAYDRLSSKAHLFLFHVIPI